MTVYRSITWVLLFALVACRTSKQPTSETTDLGTHRGYEVYQWPERSTLRKRNYDDLRQQMTEFSETVGTCLLRTPEGKSEIEWVCGIRGQKRDAVDRAVGDARRWCDAVKKQYVDDFLPIAAKSSGDRSPYCQYANCGEGGPVGACLAFDFGFQAEEIRICTSKNDHVFSMVKDTRSRDWCLLDRWFVYDYFRCGINWNQKREVMTINSRPSDVDWYQKVRCKTLAEYMQTKTLP